MSLDSWERNAIQRHSRVLAAVWTIADMGYYFSLIFGFIGIIGIPLHWLKEMFKQGQWLTYPWAIHVITTLVFSAFFVFSSSVKGWASSYGYKRGWVKDEDYHDQSLQ